MSDEKPRLGPSTALRTGFNTPFAEQVEFLRQKLNIPTERWDDIMRSAHDRGFMVAGAMKADLLADLHEAVNRVAAEGKSLGWFRDNFQAIVTKHGWHGWTGEGTAAGEAWRTKVIYQTNLNTSYAAGRYAQLTEPEFLTRNPYWRYKHMDGIANPRLQHVAWNGLVLPHDHPFWQTHFPPNGWGCSCKAFSVSEAEYQRAVKAGLPELPEGWDEADDKGNLPGVAKGFDYAPGRTWFPDLDKYHPEVARAMVTDNLRDGVFDRWQARIATSVADELAKPDYAGLDKEAITKLLRERLTRGEEYPVAIMAPDKQALLDVSTQVVKFSDYDAIKQAYSRLGDANFTVEAYRAVQGIMDDAELIVRESGQMSVWFRRDGRLMVGVIAQTQTGRGIYLKSLRFGSESDKRRSLTAGEEIFRK